MMREEFEQRTGFYPDQTLYAVIEKYYINSTDDKDTFCRAYKKNDGWLATKIQHEADMQAVHAQVAAEGAAKGYESRIAELEKTLECEQEWRAYEDTDNVQQGDYERLAHMIAYHSESQIDESVFRKLHAKCVEEVKRLNGAVELNDAYKYQKREN